MRGDGEGKCSSAQVEHGQHHGASDMTDRWKPTQDELHRFLEVSATKTPHLDLDWAGADLAGVDLEGVFMRRANLSGAILRRANLAGADLLGANLRGADLSEADLYNANLVVADLRDANLTQAFMTYANLLRADLTGAKLHDACLDGSVFGDTMMIDAEGLDLIRFSAPSIIDLRTIEKSWPLPDSFLRGCGLHDDYIRFIHEHMFEPIQVYSCFISYSTVDEEFATRLHNDFQAAGIRCWKWDHDARTGRSIWSQITDAIRLYEKTVLIASESSLRSPYVNDEIERAIQKERELQRKRNEGDKTIDPDVLFPVRLDDYILDSWEHERKPDVVKKVIADAREWKDPDKYATLRDKLIDDLKKARRVVGG